MRVVAHRGLRDVDVGWEILDAYRRVVIDVGAGDGRFVLRRASAHPDWLVVGVDANAAGLYDGFRRAAKAELKNSLFVVGSAEALPEALAGRAHEVRVQFPWGSLLHAIVRPDRHVIGGIAGLLRPGGALTVLLSVIERDGIQGVERLDQHRAEEVASRIARLGAGLHLDACRGATAADIAGSHSTWARRLGVGRSRPAWLLQFHRSEAGG